MITLIVVFAGALLMLIAAIFPGLAFAVFGDEMPEWVENWAPLISVLAVFAGFIMVSVGMVLLTVHAVRNS